MNKIPIDDFTLVLEKKHVNNTKINDTIQVMNLYKNMTHYDAHTKERQT